ncbi:MAG TPA: hypothetical protein DE045_08815 [Oceanospirillaceae bacterium]|nr:hypothetical protein [Oceanospirillaceae bacterium]
MAIGILPMELRKIDLPSCPISNLDWPSQNIPKVNTVGELGPEDQIVVYPNSGIFYKARPKLACKVSLVFTEPKAIHAKYYRTLGLIRNRFHRVICRYPEYAKTHSNVLLMQVIETWVSDEAINNSVVKTKSCSLIASAKKNLEGHRLRHRIADWCQEHSPTIELLGKAYQPFEKKEDGLAPYHHSIIIENNQEKEYYTEKLLDCMLCNTMPIYWGCPNIGEYFDTKGLIICETEAELKQAILNIDQALSEEQKQAMTKNKAIALKLSKLNQRIVDLLYNDQHNNP